MFLLFLAGLLVFDNAFGACDKDFSSSSGTVTSPGYHDNPVYASNLSCTYDINVGSNRGVKLSWSVFDVRGTMPYCSNDYVEVFVGCDQQSIGKYCSDKSYLPFDIYSSDNCVRIKFHSDGSGVGQGFVASYAALDLSLEANDLGYCTVFRKTLTSNSGVINTNFWPLNYSWVDCKWTIEVGYNMGIKIAFMDFEIEEDCSRDSVIIKGGDLDETYDDALTIKNAMCGFKNPFFLISSEEKIWITFKSAGFDYARGFVAGYVLYDRAIYIESTVRTSTTTTTTTNSAASDSSSKGSSPSAALVAGSIGGAVAVLVIIGATFYFCVYRKRRAPTTEQTTTPAPEPYHNTQPPAERKDDDHTYDYITNNVYLDPRNAGEYENSKYLYISPNA